MKYIREQKDDLLSLDSTITKSHKEKENTSLEEDDEITQETNNIVQIKLIKKLQVSISILQVSQQQMLTHIASLEDTVIALSDTKGDSAEYRKAQRIEKKIKRKC